jgi:hypothetical protein
MAIVLTGTKTVTKDQSPAHTAAALTTILATPIEQLTIAQLRVLTHTLESVPGGHDPTKVVGDLLP